MNNKEISLMAFLAETVIISNTIDDFNLVEYNIVWDKKCSKELKTCIGIYRTLLLQVLDKKHKTVKERLIDTEMYAKALIDRKGIAVANGEALIWALGNFKSRHRKILGNS